MDLSEVASVDLLVDKLVLGPAAVAPVAAVGPVAPSVVVIGALPASLFDRIMIRLIHPSVQTPGRCRLTRTSESWPSVDLLL
jgi:hypothetical protein